MSNKEKEFQEMFSEMTDLTFVGLEGMIKKTDNIVSVGTLFDGELPMMVTYNEKGKTAILQLGSKIKFEVTPEDLAYISVAASVLMGKIKKDTLGFGADELTEVKALLSSAKDKLSIAQIVRSQAKDEETETECITDTIMSALQDSTEDLPEEGMMSETIPAEAVLDKPGKSFDPFALPGFEEFEETEEEKELHAKAVYDFELSSEGEDLGCDPAYYGDPGEAPQAKSKALPTFEEMMEEIKTTGSAPVVEDEDEMSAPASTLKSQVVEDEDEDLELEDVEFDEHGNQVGANDEDINSQLLAMEALLTGTYVEHVEEEASVEKLMSIKKEHGDLAAQEYVASLSQEKREELARQIQAKSKIPAIQSGDTTEN